MEVTLVNYVWTILARQGRMKASRGGRPLRFVDAVSCARCRGSGSEEKHGTRCRACGGRGRVEVPPPVVTCLFCRGSGSDIGDLSCLGCGGLGVVPVRAQASVCPRCDGDGREGVFYCAGCRGQGMT